MSRNTKIVIALLVVCVLVVGVIGYLATQRRAGQSAAATATVVATEAESGRRGKQNTILILSYPTASGSAQGRARVSGAHPEEYPAGRQLRVCYNPADTGSVRVESGACG